VKFQIPKRNQKGRERKESRIGQGNENMEGKMK